MLEDEIDIKELANYELRILDDESVILYEVQFVCKDDIVYFLNSSLWKEYCAIVIKDIHQVIIIDLRTYEVICKR